MTYLLVHGGGSTGRFWDRLLPLLDAPALAVDLPGRNGVPGDLATQTVDDEVRSVVEQVEAARLADPVVVVAHSSGALVVPGVVRALGGRVAHIVLVAALVPPEGGRGVDCMSDSHREGLTSAVEQVAGTDTPIILPGVPEDPESFRTAYGGDPLDDDTLAYMVDPGRCVPDTVQHYFQPVNWSLAAGVPVTYVLTERDRPVRTHQQEEMVTHLPGPSTVVRVDGGHLPPVTDAPWLADVIHSVVA